MQLRTCLTEKFALLLLKVMFKVANASIILMKTTCTDATKNRTINTFS